MPEKWEISSNVSPYWLLASIIVNFNAIGYGVSFKSAEASGEGTELFRSVLEYPHYKNRPTSLHSGLQIVNTRSTESEISEAKAY